MAADDEEIPQLDEPPAPSSLTTKPVYTVVQSHINKGGSVKYPGLMKAAKQYNKLHTNKIDLENGEIDLSKLREVSRRFIILKDEAGHLLNEEEDA